MGGLNAGKLNNFVDMCIIETRHDWQKKCRIFDCMSSYKEIKNKHGLLHL